MATPSISEAFLDSPWYSNTIFVLKNLQAPPRLTRTKARFIKLKAMRYCILDNVLYWKEQSGILLNCLLNRKLTKFLQNFMQVIVEEIYTGKVQKIRFLELVSTGLPYLLM